jgi:hypothetical protein
MNKIVLVSVLLAVVTAMQAPALATDITVTATQGRTTCWDQTNPSTADIVQSASTLRTRASTNTNYKSWVQFDLSSIYAANPGLKGNIGAATLMFTGAADHGSGKSYIVNGLNDSAGLEGWISSSTTWNNAPGNNTASTTLLNTSLTTASIATGNITGAAGTVSYASSDALKSFLNTDTNGLVTVIMTPGGTATFYNVGSAGAPTLTITTTTPPIAKAFPGAEGYGATASGGRGGAVYEVTNLNDSGTGSFRWALQQSGPRTVVFRVSGTIYLLSNLGTTNNDVTIAGQTAPGDGITLAGAQFVVNSSNVIVRYIRCRLGDIKIDGTQAGDSDAAGGVDQDKVIIDHVSASWSSDETFSFYKNTNFTAQWCMITESMRHNHHIEDWVTMEVQNHGYGGIWGGTNTSWHHNLLAHHDSRNPRWGGEASQFNDSRNNVIYNWGGNSCYGADNATVTLNMVGNYYKWGPATGTKNKVANPSWVTVNGTAVVPHQYAKWYIWGNYVDGYPAVTADNWNGGVIPDGGTGDLSLCKPSPFVPFAVTAKYPVSEQTPETAYNYVLASVGCSISRDMVDTRIIREARTRTATYGDSKGAGTGIIDSQVSVGGWPKLDSAAAPTDTDHDGMPDAWETANGFNPNDASDRNGHVFDPNYTNLEVYINSLCPDPYGSDLTPPSPELMTFSTAPYSSGALALSMTASAASDTSGVQYYFMCVDGGGHSSGWQDSRTYTDTGLTAGVTYAYRIKARDKSALHNTTQSSEAFSATAFTHACNNKRASDLNFDCQVDFLDFPFLATSWDAGSAAWASLRQFATDWLMCDRNPSSQCWQ